MDLVTREPDGRELMPSEHYGDDIVSLTPLVSWSLLGFFLGLLYGAIAGSQVEPPDGFQGIADQGIFVSSLVGACCGAISGGLLGIGERYS